MQAALYGAVPTGGYATAVFWLSSVWIAAAHAQLAPSLPLFDEDDSSECVRYHRPGKQLFYKDTAIFPIAISVPAALVVMDVPPKSRAIAPFVGSSRGGDTAEYKFGPLDEDKYRSFYTRHRFAHTRKKGGWDALRHVEILAAGAVPIFHGLAEVPPFVVPYLPVAQLLQAQQDLLPYDKQKEGLYNSTVRTLLGHTRQCLTSESIAARVLRTLGLWPTSQPLKLLYITCGWGFTTFDDGWQGPVSIGLFLGLHGLLRNHPGSRIVDAPPIKSDFLEEHTHRSHLWYTFERDHGCRFSEENLRRLMYGYGFSYARRIPRESMAAPSERARVRDGILHRQFDAIIYGKVGPTQGCDPLPYMQEVQDAGYPPQRVALVYGGDFGLSNKNVSTHMRLLGEFGTIFVREIDAPADTRFVWRPKSVLPSSCFTYNAWRSFFKLWEMRLRCWGCPDIDDAIVDALWPALKQTAEPQSEKFTMQSLRSSLWESERCWSGLALLSMPLLAGKRSGLIDEDCRFARRQLEALHARAADSGGPSIDDDFLDAFGVRPTEVYAFVCHACRGINGWSAGDSLCQDAAAILEAKLSPFTSQFDAKSDRLPLAELRTAMLLRDRIVSS